MKLGFMRNQVAAVLTLCSVATTPGMAQTVALNPSVMVGWTGGAAVDDDIQRRARRSPAAATPSFRSLGRSALSPSGGAATAVRATYRPSTTVRQRNQSQFVARIRARDPKAGAELQQAFASRDLIGQVGGVMRSVGLDPANVADAMSLYLVSAWHGVRGSDDGGSRDEYRAVSQQMARAFATTPGFAAASDALKQEIAESMMVQALLAGQAVTAAKRQPGAMANVRTALAQGAKSSFGFDLTSMQLSASGLR